MCAIDEKPFPRAPLVGAAALVAVTIGLVGLYQAGALPSLAPEPRPAAVVEAAQDVRFFDRADGAVVVAPVSGAQETVVEPGAGGFLRVVMRGFAADRRARGLGAEAPFRLERLSDGGLTVTDTATGRRVSLEGFGADNRQAFAALLEGAA